MLKLREIVWDDGKYSCYTARIGKARVATVNYSAGKDDQLKWIRTVGAFGLRLEKRYATREAAQLSVADALFKLLNVIADYD